MTTVEKEKEVILDVLEMYKHMPFLWNKNHVDYKNKVRRMHANEMLLEVYKKIDANANMPTLNKKIQNLRTSYYKELRKVKEAEELNEPVYEPTLWYFDALTFLGDKTNECCHIAKEKDPLKTEHASHSSSDGEGSYQTSETYTTPPPVKKRKFTNPIVYKSTNNSVESAAEKPPHMKDEEWEVFGKAIGLQLRDLDKKQLTIAQKIISDAIYYAKFGLLSPKTYINLGTPQT